MATKEQRLEAKKKLPMVLELCCGSNAYAKSYLNMLCSITRVIDDIYDQDAEVTRESLLNVFEELFVKLPTNPFFIQYQDVLLSQHLSMWNSWVAANKWKNGDETEQIYSHVWRYTIHEVFPIVALLTQGYNHMKFTSNEVRNLYKTKLGED